MLKSLFATLVFLLPTTLLAQSGWLSIQLSPADTAVVTADALPLQLQQNGKTLYHLYVDNNSRHLSRITAGTYTLSTSAYQYNLSVDTSFTLNQQDTLTLQLTYQNRPSQSAEKDGQVDEVGRFMDAPAMESAKSYGGSTELSSVSVRSKKTASPSRSRDDSRIEPPTSAPSPNGESGVLTAGELQDFNKWPIWQELHKGEFQDHAKTWDAYFTQRVAILLTNQEEFPVVNARVELRHENQTLWTAYTDNTGAAELWWKPFEQALTTIKTEDLRVEIVAQGQHFTMPAPAFYQEGINFAKLPLACSDHFVLDLAFVVDATGSMGDEIHYLKAELEDIIGKVQQQHAQMYINTGAVFYRDNTDAYVTRLSPMTNNLKQTQQFINAQNAGGGGDFPEAIDSALIHGLEHLAWSEDAHVRIMFLLLDAPPHEDAASKKRMQRAMQLAAEKGVKIVPIVGSGINKSTEHLMRSLAVATNGTYLFLTDHSGIGGSHIAPSTDSFKVYTLNEKMQEVINRYASVRSCFSQPTDQPKAPTNIIDQVLANEQLAEIQQNPAKRIEATVLNTQGEVVQQRKKIRKWNDEVVSNNFQLYPNPTAGNLQITWEGQAERIFLMDANGKVLRQIPSPAYRKLELQLSAYPDGMYYIGYFVGDRMEKSPFVLQKN